MSGPVLPWDAEALRQQLAAVWPGFAVEIVDRTGSTSTDLLERVTRAARFVPTLRVAEEQTGGRGRRGRAWQSARGASLTFSLAVPLVRSDWSGLSLALGVALAEALDAGTVARIGLKWPNDLLLGERKQGRKLAGILVETAPRDGRRIAIVGIGVNVTPPEAHGDFDRTALTTGLASVDELRGPTTPPDVLQRVAAPLLVALQRFDAEGFAPFAARYAARDALAGRPVQTTQADTSDGIARGIAPDGALLVERPDGMLQRVASGEVSVRVATARATAPC